ncbi:MAG: DMT family transporter [Thermoanaerobaculia bacterium]|nr:DMT family transporter [Thermoanaerobaculia bacterium]
MSPRGVGLAFVSALLFGLATPASKLLLERLGPLQLAGLLYLGAALGMAVPALRDPRGFVGLDVRNGGRLAGAVILGGVAGPVLLLFGLEMSSAGSVSLLLNFELAGTALVGVFLFREHLAAPAWVGIAGIAVAGLLVSREGGWPGAVSAVLVVAACLCWAFDNHFTALIDGTTPAHTTFVKGLVAGAVTLAAGLAMETWRAGPAVVTAALAVGILSYGASIVLYIVSAQEIGATRAQAVFAAAPFLGAGLSLVVLGEAFGLLQVAAVVVLIPSVALVLLGQHSHEHVHEAIDHVHSHRHDDGHHDHVHPGLPAWVRHSHWHHHEPLRHTHPHWPDLHHRHRHREGETTT